MLPRVLLAAAAAGTDALLVGVLMQRRLQYVLVPV
jgi:hypothetical protein